MGKSVHNEETRKLMEGILKLQSVEECYAFFEDLCTVNELLSLGCLNYGTDGYQLVLSRMEKLEKKED